ncbi:type II secretion system protein [Patescibacteria group bacterium]|nr:type II secretion system protein [Patescibacteria group bacterium]
MKRNVSLGFTLIELLIVIALIAVLAGAVVIALNPARQFAAARNSERWSHVSAIVGAVTQNTTENKGTFTCAAGVIPTSATIIKKTGGYDLCSCLVPDQMSTIPVDPSSGSFTDCTTYDTGYSIERNATTGRITVSATGAENSETISVTQ